jgi:GT2 family glycosyltransferase
VSEAPEDIRALAEQRAHARDAKDFTRADALRDLIVDAGWAVVDAPTGWTLEATTSSLADPMPARDAGSRLGEPATSDVSMHWVCEGWPQDIARAVASFRMYQGDRDVQYVVADVTGADQGAFGEDVETIELEANTGWAAARNAGLIRSTGAIVLAMDGSIEASGDVVTPLEAALADPTVGIAGPFGIDTHDLREFAEAIGPGDVDAVEGYCMAMRRDLLTLVGRFDEKFRWYRMADVEFSFRVKDSGLRTVVVEAPVTKHEHRLWFQTDPAERAKWSKRNYYRFLERWRDRWDLVLDPRPPEAGADEP